MNRPAIGAGLRPAPFDFVRAFFQASPKGDRPVSVALKQGVSLKGLQPQMILAAMIVAAICKEYGVACVITSGSDGRHSANSLHYSGKALDFRTRELVTDAIKRQFRDRVAEALNGSTSPAFGEFDVVLEATHLHVEYDPPATDA